MTFEEFIKENDFLLFSRQQPLFRKCWETAQAEAKKKIDTLLDDISELQARIEYLESKYL